MARMNVRIDRCLKGFRPLLGDETGFVDEKLSGCGTHMEHIVFVHDLFLTLTAKNGVHD